MVVEMDDEEYSTLPVSVDLATAGRAFGLGRTRAFELARAKEFPCQVIPVGRRADGSPAKYRVARAAIYEKLGQPKAVPASPPAA